MGELKELLQSAREKKGFTLRDIAERTRISYTFLEAIEEENFSVIPGEVFVTGFLRTYARELGVDEKEAVALYKKLKAPAQEAPEQKEVSTPPALAAGEKPSKFRLSYVLVAGLVLGAVIVAVMLLVTREEAPETAPPAPQVSAPPPTETFAPSTSVTPESSVLDNMTTPAVAAPAPPAAASPLVLKVEAVGDSWYSYRIDGGERQNGALKKGDGLVVEADEKIVLSLGNAGGVRLTFNGKPAGPFGPEGAVRKGILFTKDAPGVVLPAKPARNGAGAGVSPGR